MPACCAQPRAGTTRTTFAAFALLIAGLCGPVQAQIIFDAQPPAQTQTPSQTPAQADACVNVTVDVVGEHPAGGDWDDRVGAWALPDPMISETTTGATHACDDSRICSFNIPKAGAKLHFIIYDDDIDADDLIGEADCTAGKTCTVGRARVSTGRC